MTDDYLAILATIRDARKAELDRLAQAWDEGWATCYHHDERAGLPAPGNPYREGE